MRARARRPQSGILPRLRGRCRGLRRNALARFWVRIDDRIGVPVAGRPLHHARGRVISPLAGEKGFSRP